jgi:hypothetical protein
MKFIWKEVNELIKSDLDDDLKNKQLKFLADDFYDVFSSENSPIPIERANHFYTDYNSVFIRLGAFSFLIPYDFYAIAQLKTPPKLNPLFEMTVSWYNFLSYFYETANNTRKLLKDSDTKIMIVMTQYQPKYTDKAIPFTKQEIGKLAGQVGHRKKSISENTVVKSLMYLYNEYILQDFYLINPWAIGLTLKLLVYNKDTDKEMDNWDKWTKYKQILMSDKIFRIVQIPQHAEGEFDFPKNIVSFEIHEFRHSNNINQIMSKSQNSFLEVPNFEIPKESTSNYTKFNVTNDIKWIDDLLNMEYSQKPRKEVLFGSLNKIKKNQRLNEAQKFLNFLSKEQRIRPPISKCARRANLEEIEFLDFCRFFLKMKVINFATRTNFIGCNYRIGVLIRSKEVTVENHPQLQLFLQNLLELPLSNAFIGEHIIISYINLPINWVGAFTTYLNILMTHKDLEIEFGLHMALQSYVKWNTPFSEDVLLTSYGMLYNPD